MVAKKGPFYNAKEAKMHCKRGQIALQKKPNCNAKGAKMKFVVYSTVSFAVFTSRLLGPIMMLKSPGSTTGFKS